MSTHLSEFSLYVGFSADYTQNASCSSTPFLPYDPTDPYYSFYGTYNDGTQWKGTQWPNGVEAWCNLPGDYVSFVREATA